MSTLTANPDCLSPAPLPDLYSASSAGDNSGLSGLPAPTPTLPQSSLLPDQWQQYASACTEPHSSDIASALIDVATVLQSLDAHFAELLTPAMNVASGCAGCVSGACQCTFDECAAVCAKMANKIGISIANTLADAQGYLAQAAQGLAQSAPTNIEGSPYGSSPLQTPTGATPNNVAPYSPSDATAAGLYPAAPALSEVGITSGTYGTSGASAGPSAGPYTPVGAVSVPPPVSVPATELRYTAPGQLLASVSGGSIVISPQQSPLTLTIQCLTPSLIQSIIQAVTAAMISVQAARPKGSTAPFSGPSLAGAAPEGQESTTPQNQPGEETIPAAFAAPAGAYTVDVPEGD